MYLRYSATATYVVQRIHRAVVLEQLSLTDHLDTSRCYMKRLAESSIGGGVADSSCGDSRASNNAEDSWSSDGEEAGARRIALRAGAEGGTGMDKSVLAYFKHVVLVSAHQVSVLFIVYCSLYVPPFLHSMRILVTL